MKWLVCKIHKKCLTEKDRLKSTSLKMITIVLNTQKQYGLFEFWSSQFHHMTKSGKTSLQTRPSRIRCFI